VPLLTVNYNLAGVLDSLGEGRLAPIQAQAAVFYDSPTAPEHSIEANWRRVLGAPARVPLRVVAALRPAVIDEPRAAGVIPALEAAAVRLGLHVELEASFTTATGLPVVGVYRVSR
jgi:hypothetical protein